MQEFINIFAEMGWASSILLIFGGILLVAETLTPGFNVAGFSGLICLVLGIIARVAEGATLTQTLILILLVIIIVGVLFIIFVKSAKSGVISKTPIIETGTAISNDYVKIANADLLNKTGITKTVCKPVGKVVVNDKIYDAITSYGYIEANRAVVIEKVDFDYLYIKEIAENKQIGIEDLVMQGRKNKEIEQTKQKNQSFDTKTNKNAK